MAMRAHGVLMMLRLFLVLLFLSLPVQVFAQDEKPEDPTTQKDAEETAESPEGLYSPDFCEFGITFPEKPYPTRQCDDAAKTKCYDLVSYTQVFEMTSTINFRVICNPVSAKTAEDFTEDVMLITLRSMAKDSGADEFNADARTGANYKQGGLAGMGTVGRSPMIYVSQLWVGEQSILSVEGELIGDAFEEADRLFSEILKSVDYTGKKDIPAPPKTAAPDKE